MKTWQANAQSVQDDILRSKALAAEIVKASEAPAVSGRAVDEIEANADFLIREINYNTHVKEALKGIKTVNRTLDEVEQARDERRILDALHLLESKRCAYRYGLSSANPSESWKELDMISVNRSCRAVKLLDIRAFELKSDVHEVFDHLWNTLVNVDVENKKVLISSTRQGKLRCCGPLCRLSLTSVGEPMSLDDAVIGLKAYKEVDERMGRLWQDINQAVLLPRMDITKDTLPGVHAQDVSAPFRFSRCLVTPDAEHPRSARHSRQIPGFAVCRP